MKLENLSIARNFIPNQIVMVMYQKKIPENFECGISVALKVLGGKWNPLIIEYIQMGVRRPSELHRAVDLANPRVINMALRELEDYKIIHRKVYHEIPLRTEYFLTPLGFSLLPIIEQMEKWGDEHREEIIPDYSMPDNGICKVEVKYNEEASR